MLSKLLAFLFAKFHKPIYKKHGWVPDLPDPRDFKRVLKTIQHPISVDLRTNGKLPEIWNQGELGSCHDEKTEILTDNGWVLFPELTENHKLATVNPETHELIYEFPTRIIKLPYNGSMIVGKHKSLDFMVTPDHKMLVRKWDESKRTLDSAYTLINAKDLGWYSGLLGSVSFNGIAENQETICLPGVDHKHCSQRSELEVPLNLWLMLLGIYVAEGTLCKNKNHYRVQLAAYKEREKIFIKTLLVALKINFNERADRITFDHKQIYTAIKELGFYNIKATEKFVPDFIFTLNSELIENFLLGHFMGDGSEQRGIKTYYTSSKKLQEDIQRLLFLSGHLTGCSERKSRTSIMTDGRIVVGKYPEYSIRQLKTKLSSIDKKRNISEETYSGFVYCAEVPTYHTLVTKRNNKILISGNCGAHASGAAYDYLLGEEQKQEWMPSRLFIYYNTRVIENTVNEDAGVQIRDVIKELAATGTCHEDLWQYNIEAFRLKPNDKCYDEAKKQIVLKYESVPQTEQDIENVLAEGFPVIFGATLFNAFESATVANSGMVPMPSPTDGIVGGHAILIVGYDQTKRLFTVRNSWGNSWGDKGYCYFPYDYILNTDLCSDFWALTAE